VPEFRRSADLCGRAPDIARLQLAQTILLLGRLDEAEREYRRLLDEDPTHAAASLGLGRILFERGKLADALDTLAPAADGPLTRKAAALLSARVRRGLGDLAGADRDTERAAGLPEDPPWPDPFLDDVSSLDRTRNGYLNRIALLRRQGRQQQADALTKESWDDYTDLRWMAEGKRHLEQGRVEDAERAARKAVEIADGSAQAHVFLGEVLFVRQDYAGAAGAFRRATRLDPGNGSAHHALGRCLLEQGKPDEAIPSFRTAALYLPESAKTHRDLGDALARTGRTDEALPHLRQAVRLDPADEEARQRLEEVEKEVRRRKE
jgi:tetratricopeptide (TPR) repeat protein